MNTILGGKFTSRLNLNLREDKGYTYGAGSQFIFRQGPGSFIAYAQVHSEFTKESLVEFSKELNGIAGSIPVGAEELEETKKYITLRYPREFETISQVGGKLNQLVAYDLPENYFNTYVPSIGSVTGDGVAAAGKKYVRTSGMLYIIMGDIEKIEAGIKELNLGEIHYLDAEGNPVNK